MTTLELPLQQNGKESYEEDEHNNQDTNLMLQQRKPTILELLIASSTSLASSSSLGNFKVENLSRLTRIASHPFRSLISIKYNSYIFFYYNGRWSDFSIKLDRNIYSLEWDCHTDRLYVGTETNVVVYKFTSLDENDLSQYSTTTIQIPLPPAILSLIAPPLRTHTLKSCPRGRFLAILSSTFASGWTYREVTLWDCYSSISTALTLPGYGWKYQHFDGFTCLEWSPTGQYLAVGASDGSVLVLNTITWNSSSCCVMPSSITSIAWISAVDFLFSTYNTTLLHSVHLSPSESDDEIYPTISPTPINMISHITAILSKVSSDEIRPESVVVEKFTVNTRCNLLAITFNESKSSSAPFPFVGLFLLASRPLLSVCLLRILTPPTSPFVKDLGYPIDCAFLVSSDHQILIYWSNKMVSIESDREERSLKGYY